MGEVYKVRDTQLDCTVAIKDTGGPVQRTFRARGKGHLCAESPAHLYALRRRSELSRHGVSDERYVRPLPPFGELAESGTVCALNFRRWQRSGLDNAGDDFTFPTQG